MIPPPTQYDLERDLQQVWDKEALHTPNSLLASIVRLAAHWKKEAERLVKENNELAERPIDDRPLHGRNW